MSTPANELFVVVERSYVSRDDGPAELEEQPVGVFFSEAHAMAWCDQQLPRQLHWVAVPALDV
jgi:hypothetical protein